MPENDSNDRQRYRLWLPRLLIVAGVMAATILFYQWVTYDRCDIFGNHEMLAYKICAAAENR